MRNSFKVNPVLMNYETPPRIIDRLLLFISFYMAAPLLVIPYLGFSYSAPLIFFLLFETLRRFNGLNIFKRKMFAIILYVFWYGLFISFIVNVYSDDINSDILPVIIMLINYAYWCMAGLLAFRLLANTDLPNRIVYAFCFGIVFLSIIVIIEYLGFGGLLKSGWSAITRLSQNGYGWQFSAFTPFLFFPLFFLNKKAKLLSVIALSIVLFAVVINNSRGSWVALICGMSLYMVLLSMSSKKKIKISLFVKTPAFLIIICLTVYVSFKMIPANQLEHISDRLETFRDLQEDKSYQIRQVVFQKGWQLFLENSVVGIGPSNFKNAVPEANLEIPDALSYARQGDFETRSSHNSYIMVLAEAGLIGFIPYSVLIVWLAIVGLKAALHLAKNGEGWALSLYTSFVSMSIHQWAVTALTSTAPWFLYGFMAAMIFRYKKMLSIERLSYSRALNIAECQIQTQQR